MRALLAEAAEAGDEPELTEAEPWAAGDAFQLGGVRCVERTVLADGQEHTATLEWQPGGVVISIDGGVVGGVAGDLATGEFDLGPEIEPPYTVVADGAAFVLHNMNHTAVSWPVYDVNNIDEGDSADTIRAPINGRVAKLFVGDGVSVAEGDPIAVVEAMKMEHVLSSPRAGVVEHVHAQEGAQVNQGTVIASLRAEEEA